MSLILVTSPRSSPGVTSLSVGLATAWKQWGFDPLLIEADPAGGVLAHRFAIEGNRSRRNLLTFASDTRRSFSGAALANNTNLIMGVEALIAPVDPVRASQAIERSAPVIVEHIAGANRPVIADVGRLSVASPAAALAEGADHALVVIRPEIDLVQASLFQLRQLRELGVPIEVVFVGDEPIDPHEAASLLEIPIAAVLPTSPRTASALVGGRYKQRQFQRSPLWRSISALASRLAPMFEAPEDVAVESAGPPPPPPPLDDEADYDADTDDGEEDDEGAVWWVADDSIEHEDVT